MTSFWIFNLFFKDVLQEGQSNIISLGGADLIGPIKKIPHIRILGFKSVCRQKAVLGIFQHLPILLIRPLLRCLLFFYLCYQVQAGDLLGVFNFGFLLICFQAVLHVLCCCSSTHQRCTKARLLELASVGYWGNRCSVVTQRSFILQT